MTTTRRRTFARVRTTVLLLAAGCAHLRIDDVELVSPGADVGDASATLVTRPATADASVLADDLGALEAALVELTLAHDAWATSDTREVRDLRAPTGGPDGIAWDGVHLDAGIPLPDGGLMVADLRLYRGGTQHIDSVPGGVCIQAEPAGSDGQIECPPFVDGTVVLGRSVLVQAGPAELVLEARYGLGLDGEGRAVGGQVEVDYLLTPEGADTRGGFVSATFHGLGRVQVFTRQ